MTLTLEYTSPTTPGHAGWVVDLGTTSVRLGSAKGLIQDAEAGTVPISNIVFDDPTGTLGHSADGILGLKGFRVIESAAPAGNQTVFIGYFGTRRYSRGDSSRPSLRTSYARQVDAEVTDLNAIFTFRIIEGAKDAAHGDRPAETDVARITWLIGTVFLPLVDHGLFSTAAPVTLPAADLRGKTAFDVMRDCATASGKNFFAYYDEASGDLSLFYDFLNTPSTSYDSTTKISNVLSEIDTTNWTVWYVADDMSPTLVRDPSQVYAGTVVSYGSGQSVYVTNPNTSYVYAWRDGAAPASSGIVKTAAEATALGQKYLGNCKEEEDRIINLKCKVPAAHVNDIKVGQRVQVHLTFAPGYDTGWTWVRIVKRTWAQDEETDEFYNLTFEAVGAVNPCDPSVSMPAHFVGPLGGAGNTANPVTDIMGPYYTKPGSGALMPDVGFVGIWNNTGYEGGYSYGWSGAPTGVVDYTYSGGVNHITIYCLGDGTITVWLGSVYTFSGSTTTASTPLIVQNDYSSLPILTGGASVANVTLMDGATPIPFEIRPYTYHVTSADPTQIVCYHAIDITLGGPISTCQIGYGGFSWQPDVA